MFITIVVSWPPIEAQGPRKREGQASMDASSTAIDHWRKSERARVCAMFPECGVLLFVLYFFLLLLVQLKFPEGKTKNKTPGPKAHMVLRFAALGHHRISPVIPEVQDLAGHKSRERGEEHVVQEGEGILPLTAMVACVVQTWPHFLAWVLSLVTGPLPLSQG